MVKVSSDELTMCLVVGSTSEQISRERRLAWPARERDQRLVVSVPVSPRRKTGLHAFWGGRAS